VLIFGAGKGFEGLIPNLRRRYDEGAWASRRSSSVPLAPPVFDVPRPAAQAAEPLGQGEGTHDLGLLEPSDRRGPGGVRRLQLTDREAIIAERILKEIQERLRFLNDVGVGYLTLGRGAATLSGGEGQRIRLATQMARTSPACSTCSTSRRSACTSAITGNCSATLSRLATLAIP